jgi:hypothetical protein
MQHFRLTLSCGHYFEETAVEFHGVDHNGSPKPYAPDYRGRRLKCQHPACRKNADVTAQESIPNLVGILNLPDAPKPEAPPPTSPEE